MSCLCALSFSQEEDKVPFMLSGIWENYSRYVVFDTESEENAPDIVLRIYYQWYNDRAAEDSSLSEENPRNVNNATPRSKAQSLKIRYIPLTDELYPQGYEKNVVQEDGDVLFSENVPSGAWDMQVTFPGVKEVYHIPIAVIGDELYLNFAIKKEDSDAVPSTGMLEGITVQSGNLMAGFWQDYSLGEGIFRQLQD